MKGTVVAETAQIEFQTLGLDQPLIWRIVDDEMGKVRLACHRTQGCKFRHGEAGEIERVRMRIGHALEDRSFRAVEAADLAAKLGQIKVGHGQGLAP